MIINGKLIADNILEKIKEKVFNQKRHFVLGAVLVGSDLALEKFVDLKAKAAEKAGVGFKYFNFPEDIGTVELTEQIKQICNSGDIDGLLVELPLSKHLKQQDILNAVSIEKDVDVLSSGAQEKFYAGPPAGGLGVLPPAVEALKIVMNEIGLNPKGKSAAVFGRGLLVGKPAAYWLKNQGAEVSEIDEFTENPKQYSVKADIIVSGVGKPGLITGEMVKDGVCVFDFGYGLKDGKTAGDIELVSVATKCRYITPVPGGMGPIVVAAVMGNLVKLAKCEVRIAKR